MDNDSIARVAAWVDQASTILAFTGAGISTESGIPDFRSPGGVWANSTPVYYDQFLQSESARFEYWRQKSESHDAFFKSPPNQGHLLLAKWGEEPSKSVQVATQNIDGLHEVAGSRDVIEIHGSARSIACIDCGSEFPADPLVRAFRDKQQVPPCPSCSNGRLKHATISFGQSLNPETLERAVSAARNCDLCIVLGSSLVVEPAASLPLLAVESGAQLVIINRDPTDKDRFADIVINNEIGPTMEAIDQARTH